jgi:hypothetical protein
LVAETWEEATGTGEISELAMTEIAAPALVGDPARDPPRALRDLAASPALCSEHSTSAGSNSSVGATPDPANRGCSCSVGSGSGALLALEKNFWLGPMHLMALNDGDEDVG